MRLATPLTSSGGRSTFAAMLAVDWIHLRALFLEEAATVLPWLLGGLCLLTVTYLSPVSRALLRYLRDRRRDSALTETAVTELRELRGALAETLERLDVTDQRLRRLP